jgi:hypothetical protein
MTEKFRLGMSGPAMAVWSALFSFYFIILRIPQLLGNWDGEDANGQCAAMILGWSPPTKLVFSRIAGQLSFSSPFPHPLPPYQFFAVIGEAIRPVVPLDTLHGQTLIFALKGIVTLLQLSVFLAVLFLAFRYAKTRVAVVWVWVMAAAPVALYAANEVQPDSSTGLVFIALFFIAALVAEAGDARPRVRMAWLVLGGFAAGLGKNEWSFCLAAALVATAVAAPLVRFIPACRGGLEGKSPWRAACLSIVPVTIGLVCGNLANYGLGPDYYMGGFRLFTGMIFRYSVVSGNGAAWWANFQAAVPYIFFHFIVDVAILIQFIRRPQIYCPTLLLAVLFANALFVAYVFNSWGAFPRYFAPAFIALGICFLMVLVRLPPKDAKGWTVAATIVLVVLQSVYYQKTSHYWTLWRGNSLVAAWIEKSASDPNHCVLVVDYSFVLDRQKIDFVHAPNGQNAVDGYLAGIGHAACPRLGS